MRYFLLLAVVLVSSCAPTYSQSSGYAAYPRPPRHARPAGGSDDCARDMRACPAPPPAYQPGQALPSLLPYSSGSQAPSYD